MKKLTLLTLTLVLIAAMAVTTANAQDWVHTATLTGHSHDVKSIAFHYRGTSRFISGSSDTTVRIWSGNLAYQRRVTHTDWIESVALRPGYYEFNAGSLEGGKVRSWDPRTGNRLYSYDSGGSDYFLSLAFRPDGERLAGGSDEHKIFIWDARPEPRGRPRTLRGHTGSVNSVAWSPDGSILASGSDDGTVRLWNPDNGINFAILRGHTNYVTGVAFSPNGRMLASVGRGLLSLILWDVNAQSRIDTAAEGALLSVAWHRDGQMLAVGKASNRRDHPFERDTVLLYEVSDAELVRKQSLRGHSDDINAVAFHPNGRILASGSNDNTVRIWEPVNRLDVTRNGSVDVNDLVEVARNYGKTVAGGANRNADVNNDGRVDINDLNEVARALDARAAPGLSPDKAADLPFTAKEVQGWIRDAKAAGIDAHDITVLEQLLVAVTRTPPKKTVLLANYPNPFNPETWIPYQLSEAAEVTVTIHASDGKLVHLLELGQVPAGIYQTKGRAAYWDGRNASNEPVASGIYFYTLTAGDFSATRKMLIRK